MARALGRLGGRTRAKRLSAERKSQIAAMGGASRARSLQAARRIADNFRYAAAIVSLRGASAKPTRRKTVKGRLPGIYPDRS
jgi:hypothetical protein